MAATRRGTSKSVKKQAPISNPLTQLELVELFHKRAVNELVVVEIEPGRYQLRAIVSWRSGHCTLAGTRGPRTFRSLDTLATHLKTMGAGPTIVRLDLLE